MSNVTVHGDFLSGCANNAKQDTDKSANTQTMHSNAS